MNTVHGVKLPSLHPPARARIAAILALTMLLGVAPRAQAQVPPETLARALALAAEAAAALAPPEARVQVEAGSLDPRLSLAPCVRAEAYLPVGMPPWGRTRVGLRCLEGKVRWNVSMPVAVQVMAPGLVALATLPAGSLIKGSQLRRIEVDWGASPLPPLDQPELAAGRTLARGVAVGQTLHAADLAPRQWFATGDMVRIVAAGAGFSIVSEGQALGPGLEGKTARIQTEGGRVLVGRPISERCVELSL